MPVPDVRLYANCRLGSQTAIRRPVRRAGQQQRHGGLQERCGRWRGPAPTPPPPSAASSTAPPPPPPAAVPSLKRRSHRCCSSLIERASERTSDSSLRCRRQCSRFMVVQSTVAKCSPVGSRWQPCPFIQKEAEAGEPHTVPPSQGQLQHMPYEDRYIGNATYYS